MPKPHKSNFNVFAPSFSFILLFITLLSSTSWSQSEYVERFDAQLTVDSSGLLHVLESIDIFATGDLFKRGIVRVLPTQRQSNNGKKYQVSYDQISVKRNGAQSPFFIEKSKNDIKIYVGDKNVYLDRGSYAYEINYTTDNQIGYFTDFDELYWNVNGTDWDVPIKNVSATVLLPEGARFQETACYTGRYGSREQRCTADRINDHSVRYTMSSPQQGHNLTIVTTFDKGVLQEPSFARETPQPIKPPGFWELNFAWIISLFVGVLILIYYGYTWFKYGIDPPKPAVYPQFTPPDDLSPASVGLMNIQYYQNKLLTASLINLAVKGFIRIEEEENKILGFTLKKQYNIIKLDTAPTVDILPQEERILLNRLFVGASSRVRIDGKYDSRIESAVEQYKTVLNSQWSSMIRKGLNVQFWIFPFVVMMAYVLYFFLFAPSEWNQDAAILKWFGGFIAVNILLFFIYVYLIRRPTEEKQKLRADIDGFEMYLKVAEVEQIKQFNPPDMTPELMERYLPYAIALGAEKVWGEKFQRVMQQMADRPDQGYHPLWYVGNIGDLSTFTDGLNRGMTNTFQSTATNPSSGSSVSGGGFSGGGGGGGGGGGW